MNKKGQLDYPIITLIVIIFGLLLIAPFTLKIVLTVKENLGNSLGNMSTEAGDIAKANSDHVFNTFTNFYDQALIFVFFIALIVMFISSFLIDAHPIFVIIYIFICFMTIIFSPSIIHSLDVVYESSTMTAEVSHLGFLDTLRTYFGEFLVGIMVVTGIIIYGKLVILKELGFKKNKTRK